MSWLGKFVCSRDLIGHTRHAHSSSEIEFRMQSVKLARAYECVQSCGMFAAAFRAQGRRALVASNKTT